MRNLVIFRHAINRRTIRSHQASSSRSARERGNRQFHFHSRPIVHGGERVQMARFAEGIRQMEQRVPTVQALGVQRHPGPHLRIHAGETHPERQSGSPRTRQHLVQGAPRCPWRVEKNGKQSIGKSRGGWNTKLHMVAADDKSIIEMHLSGGEFHDAPEGCKSIEAVGKRHKGAPMLMDKAYEGDDVRALARKNGHSPVVPPKKNLKKPWRYNKKIYKQRNVVERAFRRLDAFRRVYTRYDKTDTMFIAFIRFSIIIILLK